MKKIIIAALAALTFGAVAGAQTSTTVPEGYEKVDSLIYTHVAAYDESLAGKDIFEILENSNVTVDQPNVIREAMKKHISGNSSRTINGYRIRIFFDNQQTARVESEAALNRFKARFPEIEAYRSYSNPYFKVTVGDFRTKSEAMEMLSTIQSSFPVAFIVKESINYPAVDKERAYIIDTLTVIRKIK